MAQYEIQYYSGPKEVMYFQEDASETFKAGDIVVIEGDTGQIRIAASGDADILGISLKDASGIQGTEIPVQLILPGQVLMSSVYHGTAASAITVQTQVGSTFDLYVTSHTAYVDISATTDNIFRIQRLVPEDAVGTQYGRVLFTVVPEALQFGGSGVKD